MLGLRLATDPRWADLAAISLQDFLTDHAYCEQKAASACISLIQLHPEKTDLVDALSPIVSEEWDHFRAVLAMLREKGIALGFQRNDDYVSDLQKFRSKGGTKNDQLLDRLLICAIIEARSCERFRLLSLHFEDEKLREFYHTFMVSEAGHYRLFLDLAHTYEESSLVNKRWQELLEYESKLMNAMALRGDRMH